MGAARPGQGIHVVGPRHADEHTSPQHERRLCIVGTEMLPDPRRERLSTELQTGEATVVDHLAATDAPRRPTIAVADQRRDTCPVIERLHPHLVGAITAPESCGRREHGEVDRVHALGRSTAHPPIDRGDIVEAHAGEGGQARRPDRAGRPRHPLRSDVDAGDHAVVVVQPEREVVDVVLHRPRDDAR
jgi:hypothetical protein